MANRCGTGSTHARLSRAEVTTSYVSSPDVLLTVIDFHLFIFTLRSPTSRPLFPSKVATAPERDTGLLKFYIWSNCLSFPKTALLLPPFAV